MAKKTNEDVLDKDVQDNSKDTTNDTTKTPEQAETPDNEAPENQTEALQKEVAELKDKYLRLLAEFENFKKRNIKERLDLIRTASQDTLSALLPVLDDFDRAKKTAEDDSTTEQFSEGVTLVYNKLQQTLSQKGLKAMESTGTDFDPELHSALTEIPAPTEDMKGKVIDTIEKGYYLNDKIIRHAKVVVGK